MQCSVPAVEPTLHKHVERTAVVLSTGVVLLLLRVDSIGNLSTTGDDVVVGPLGAVVGLSCNDGHSFYH
jgi:hypothetical protein